MNRKTVYVAGQIRNDKNYRARFEAAHEWLEAQGWHVVNPLDLTRVFGTPTDVQSSPRLLRAVMDAELAAIPHLDAIYILRGWERSEGARAELAVALAHGKQILLEGAGE
jgi:hypothetical protein